MEDRTIRDTIYGDVSFGGFEGRVIDHKIFQRLRYIRQNGLLHFVFPGAVHTRFTHSIGVMHLGGVLIDSLLLKAGLTSADKSGGYIRTVFRLASLLHDVGHCAFSHSIEMVDDGRFLGEFSATAKSFRVDFDFAGWRNDSLAPGKHLDHESLGALLIWRIMHDLQEEIGNENIGVSAEQLWVDICCLLGKHCEVSGLLRDSLNTLFERVAGKAPNDGRLAQVAASLSSLVNGTLDVDRLDYLIRDSLHCGVAYGRCETMFLINNLKLVVNSGVVMVALSDKAKHAFFDFLWSRYQLTIQVLYHRTNSALNAVFRDAIAVLLDHRDIRRPSDLEDYLNLTDDSVMSIARERYLRGQLATTAVAKTLINRDVPKLIKTEDKVLNEAEVEKIRVDLAKREMVKKEEIYHIGFKSDFIKSASTVWIAVKNRADGKVEYTPADKLEEFKSNLLSLTLPYAVHHFFRYS